MSEVQEAQAPAGSWSIDKVHSTVRFEVEHNSASTYRGSFSDIDASLDYGDDGAQIKGSVKVDSISIEDEQLRGHILSAEFFDAERYPTLDFVSKEFAVENGELVVSGDLTVRGETNPVTVRGTIGEPFTNLAGSTSIAVRLSTQIDRTQYGLDWQMQLPNGNEVLGNDVNVEVELELVQG
ncbi:MAG: YceI family protein [Solirubrobacterales bacterium]